MRDFFEDFFRDEVRSGSYVPTAIKQAWAAELKVLDDQFVKNDYFWLVMGGCICAYPPIFIDAK